MLPTERGRVLASSFISIRAAMQKHVNLCIHQSGLFQMYYIAKKREPGIAVQCTQLSHHRPERLRTCWITRVGVDKGHNWRKYSLYLFVLVSSNGILL